MGAVPNNAMLNETKKHSGKRQALQLLYPAWSIFLKNMTRTAVGQKPSFALTLLSLPLAVSNLGGLCPKQFAWKGTLQDSLAQKCGWLETWRCRKWGCWGVFPLWIICLGAKNPLLNEGVKVRSQVLRFLCLEEVGSLSLRQAQRWVLLSRASLGQVPDAAAKGQTGQKQAA